MILCKKVNVFAEICFPVGSNYTHGSNLSIYIGMYTVSKQLHFKEQTLT